ncbi:hypothetical protein ACO1PK_01490 [Alishewanella sp. d11]|uniref:hypothetical protein n=1 Tax=Alishewanella sp. d11 TaxID=3414030 RepID=UPI003BF80B91
MNLVTVALNEMGITKVELIAKLGFSDEQLSKWNTDSSILPDMVKKRLLELLDIEQYYYIDWYDISHENVIIEDWIGLIDSIITSADFPSNLIASDPTFFSCAPLIELKKLGCAIPEVPLSIDEFEEMEEQDTLPPFYKLLVAYIHEMGLREKWVKIHHIEPFSAHFDLEENEDLLMEFDGIELSSIFLALRSMDKNLLKACGCSESKLKKLISETENELSIKFDRIFDMVKSKGLTMKHDLSSFLKYNGSELLPPTFKNWVRIDQEFNCASNTEQYLREQNKLIMKKLAETNSKLDELLSLQQAKLLIAEQV